MKKNFICVLSILVLSFVFGINCVNATLFLSGDTNITNPLTGSYSAPLDSGNQQFFKNILQGGDSVAVLQSTWDGSVSFADTDVNTYYNSLAGVTSTLISGTITSLAGYDLFVAPLPDHAFTISELAVFSSFLAGGGSIFFTGENNSAVFAASNAAINAALEALGSVMRINPDMFDSGYTVGTGTQIASDALTTGVNTFTYAAPSQVAGGTYLFFGEGGQPFVSYEGTTRIPEPLSILLLSLGLLGLAGMKGKIRK